MIKDSAGDWYYITLNITTTTTAPTSYEISWLERMVALDRQGSEGGEDEDGVKLDWKDYVAFVIALLQTALLPIIIILIVPPINRLVHMDRQNHSLLAFLVKPLKFTRCDRKTFYFSSNHMFLGSTILGESIPRADILFNLDVEPPRDRSLSSNEN